MYSYQILISEKLKSKRYPCKLEVVVWWTGSWHQNRQSIKSQDQINPSSFSTCNPSMHRRHETHTYSSLCVWVCGLTVLAVCFSSLGRHSSGFYVSGRSWAPGITWLLFLMTCFVFVSLRTVFRRILLFSPFIRMFSVIVFLRLWL